jgi:hypothetical protein
MTKPTPEQERPRLSCLSTFFQDGIKRIQNVIGSSEFKFVVNGNRVESTIIESVFLSPAVEALLLNDSETREFHIADKDVKLEAFLLILDFIRFGGVSQSSRSFSSQKSLFSICDHLHHHKLKLLALISPDILIPSSDFDIIIDEFASNFYQHSKSNLLEFPIALLDSILSNRKLKIQNEDWLLDLFLSGGSEFMTLFSHLKVEFLSLNGMKRFCEEIQYCDLTECIWNGIVRRLTKANDGDGRFDRWADPNGFESTIVSDLPVILDEFRNSRFNLLYRGTRDGFGSSNFHCKCDGHHDTITLIRTTKDFIFGGYTPISRILPRTTIRLIRVIGVLFSLF